MTMNYNNYCNYKEQHYIDEFEFNCCECHETYPATELTFNNGKIICKCGAKFAPEDLKPGVKTWLHRVNEFKMHNLRNDRYENISETALLTLKNKVLPRLEDEAREQAAFWEQKIKEIDMVCEAKGYEY
jgi:hypothetical protein